MSRGRCLWWETSYFLSHSSTNMGNKAGLDVVGRCLRGKRDGFTVLNSTVHSRVEDEAFHSTQQQQRKKVQARSGLIREQQLLRLETQCCTAMRSQDGRNCIWYTQTTDLIESGSHKRLLEVFQSHHLSDVGPEMRDSVKRRQRESHQAEERQGKLHVSNSLCMYYVNYSRNV